MVKYLFEAVSVIIGACILIINYLFVPSQFIPFVNVLAGLIIVGPPIYIFYARHRTREEMESQFMVFVGDLVDSMNSGMTLPMALEHCSKNDYLSLSRHVNELASQVNWGIPFEKALRTFARKAGAPTIKRAISTIIETYKVGGKISDTLETVSESLLTIDKIKKEQSLSVHSQTITMYLIYFVFIFILIVLQVFLIPALMPAAGGIPGLESSAAASPQLYTQSFVYFIVIQGFFAGLATGKMSRGTVLAGLKHSVLLIAIGYAAFSFFANFPIKIF